MKTFAAEFEKFLLERLNLPSEESIRSLRWAGTANTIGAIALRLDLLDLDQITNVLDIQERNQQLFGQIAINLEYITEQQVNDLIQLQRYHQLIDIGEILVIRGMITIERLQELILEFYQLHELQAPTLEMTQSV